MTAAAAPLAAVVLAHGAMDDDAALAARVATARAAGAEVIVVALARGRVPPAGALTARVAANAPRISALRAGLALLANRPARLALLLPEGTAPDAYDLPALVAAARREGAAVTAFVACDLDAPPVIVEREAWLELLTLGEQGIGAVAARRGLHLIPAR